MKYTPLLFLTAILFASCQAVYLPNVRNSPMFSGKGEAQGSFSAGVNGLDIQASAAVTDHIAILGNYANINPGNDFLDQTTHAWYYEGGLGYYKNYRKTCLEIFAGYGTGKGTTESKYSIEDLGTPQTFPGGPATGAYNKLFLQPSFGWNKRNLHFSLSLRVASVNFTQFSDLGSPEKVSQSFYLEPATTVKMNFLKNRLFGFAQLGLNVSSHTFSGSGLNGTSDNYYRNLNMCIGMGFRLGGKRTSTNQK